MQIQITASEPIVFRSRCFVLPGVLSDSKCDILFLSRGTERIRTVQTEDEERMKTRV